MLNYLKTKNIDPSIYNSLEVIVDLACYLNDDETSQLIDEIDKLGDNDSADLFIIKYKAINHLEISQEMLLDMNNL